MNNPHYTIQFESKNGTWTHKDDYCRDVKFDTMQEAEQVINDIFKDPKVIDASIIKWENTVVFHKGNYDNAAYNNAEIKIFDALMCLEGSDLRKKVLKKFLTHLEKCESNRP